MRITQEWIEGRIENAKDGILPIPESLDRATQALFWEYRSQCRCAERGITPIYNLSKKDHDDTLSMYQIYMQCSNEYEAAIVLLGDYLHWENLCSLPWFSKKVAVWRRERDLRDYAYGKASLRAAALKGNAQAAEKLMKLSTPPEKVGRPKKNRATVKETFVTESDKLFAELLANAKGTDNGCVH